MDINWCSNDMCIQNVVSESIHFKALVLVFFKVFVDIVIYAKAVGAALTYIIRPILHGHSRIMWHIILHAFIFLRILKSIKRKGSSVAIYVIKVWLVQLIDVVI